MSATFAVLACLAAGQAHAAGADEGWSVSVTAGGARNEDSDVTSRSGSIALERAGPHWFGASIGAAGGNAVIPARTAVSDQSSVQGSVWWGTTLAGFDTTLTLGAGRQSFDGRANPATRTPAALRGRALGVDAEVKSQSIGLDASRSFGDKWNITPGVGVSYDVSDTDVRLAPAVGTGARVQASRNAEAVTGSVRVGVARSLRESASIYAGLAGYATDDASARTFAYGRAQGASPRAAQSEGAAQWAEVSAGASFSPTARTTLSLALATTIGQDADETSAALSAQRRF